MSIELLDRPTTTPSPVLGLENEWPSTVWVIKFADGRFACYFFGDLQLNGMCAFESEAAGYRFAEFIDARGCEALEVSFDEALDLAKARPPHVTCLMLVDNFPNNPRLIQHVR